MTSLCRTLKSILFGHPFPFYIFCTHSRKCDNLFNSSCFPQSSLHEMASEKVDEQGGRVSRVRMGGLAKSVAGRLAVRIVTTRIRLNSIFLRIGTPKKWRLNESTVRTESSHVSSTDTPPRICTSSTGYTHHSLSLYPQHNYFQGNGRKVVFWSVSYFLLCTESTRTNS